MTFREVLDNVPFLLACVICIACLVQLFIIFFTERDDIKIGLKGKDKIWQFLELSGIVWLVVFPTVVIVALIIAIAQLSVEIPTGVWTTLDAVYLINVGGKGYYKSLDKKQDEEVSK